MEDTCASKEVFDEAFKMVCDETAKDLEIIKSTVCDIEERLNSKDNSEFVSGSALCMTLSQFCTSENGLSNYALKLIEEIGSSKDKGSQASTD